MFVEGGGKISLVVGSWILGNIFFFYRVRLYWSISVLVSSEFAFKIPYFNRFGYFERLTDGKLYFIRFRLRVEE